MEEEEVEDEGLRLEEEYNRNKLHDEKLEYIVMSDME